MADVFRQELVVLTMSISYVPSQAVAISIRRAVTKGVLFNGWWYSSYVLWMPCKAWSLLSFGILGQSLLCGR